MFLTIFYRFKCYLLKIQLYHHRNKFDFFRKILFLRHKRTSLAPNLWMLIYSMTSIKQFYEKHIADIQYVGEEMFWILQYLQRYRLFDFFIQTNVNLLQVSSWPL